MVNKERILETFLSFVRTDSHSRDERKMADLVRRYCEELGATVEEDNAGEAVGGNAGNIIARLPCTVSGGRPFMLSAHMDTVTPGEGVQPRVEDGRVRTDGRTILGGDDKTGVAVVIETMRVLQEQKIPHAGVEAVISICEEVGLLGAKEVDTSRLKARHGLIFDAESPTHLYTKGPASSSVEFVIHGLEAHAGVAPEQGISAIKIAAEGIAVMKLGRIDEETTANIGVIEGGGRTNIITNRVTLRGEARSFVESKMEAQLAHMRKCLEEAAAKYEVTVEGVTTRGRVETKIEKSYSAMDVADSSLVVELVKGAAKRLGFEVETLASGGGCDANIFNGQGIECANLGCGERAVHTVNEWADIADMCRAAELAVEVIKLNAEAKELS
jgi:tripeptide aminopeptidase